MKIKRTIFGIMFLALVLSFANFSYTQTNQNATTHKDSTNNYAVSYPSAWHLPPAEWIPIIKEQLTDRDLLFIIVSEDKKLNLQVAVLKEPAIPGESLEQIMKRLQDTSSVERSNVTMQTIKLGGMEAIKQIADAATPQGFPARYVHVVLIRNGRVWIIGIGGNRTVFENNNDAINGILNSVRFDVNK